MKLKLSFFSLLCLGMLEAKPPADYVNPFIGASTSSAKGGSLHGLGKTFPGATTPFGLVQVSPNTITGGDNGPGYSHEHTTIEGFAFTQMSGVGWYGDLGNFLVMPTVGELKTSPGKINEPEKGYRSRYDKASEKASAGYYSVYLTDDDIKAEATAAPHSGMLRFTFPESAQSRVQIDLARRVGGTSVEQYVKVIDDYTIQGWMKCTPEGGGWGNGAGQAHYTVYFYAKFSKPLKNYGVWSASIPEGMDRHRESVTGDAYQALVSSARVEKGCREKQGKHLGFYSEFSTKKGEVVVVASGISFVSLEGAKMNFEAEIGADLNFDGLKNVAGELWNQALSRMEIKGGDDDQKSVFYTALYHTMIDPRCFTDVNGSYPGGDGQSRRTDKFTKRTIFSGWDVFRSQYPLLTLMRPDVVNDTLNSLIELADESGKGYLERWEFLNAYSGCMVGNPAISVMADAYVKGIRNFDLEKGYRFAKNTCERFGNGERGFSVEYPISNTLEYAYSEWCLAELAKGLGKKDDEALYRKRALSYQNIFDAGKGWFRAKKEDGSWHDWPTNGRLTQDYGCIESNPYQQGWFVPHDIEGLCTLLGGKDKALSDLTDMFSKIPDSMLWNDYYNHANEPVHHIPFMFNRLGAPWLTQYWTRKICRQAYRNEVEGLVGNEDVGQMSAWYILAAAGLHPICPGDGFYEITSPVFDELTIKLDRQYATGKEFVVKTKNNSPQNVYIQSAKLNGKEWNSSRIDHATIMKGGTLEIELGKEPQKNWGKE